MAYTISNTDGTTLLFLADNSIDQSTSLTLVGKNYNNYGQYFNNNFVSLLENFASTNGEEPRNPQVGQLWYDKTGRRLNVYDGGFVAVGGAIVSGSQPSILSSGDLWWDSSNNQLKLFNNNSLYTVGPMFPKSVGGNGWVLPDSSVVDSLDSSAQQVTLLQNYGQTIGALSNSEFTLTSSDSQVYFNTSTLSLVAGLTIDGDLKVTGQLLNKYLSTTVSISYLPVLSDTQKDVTIYASYQAQNASIINYLNVMFPIAANETYSEVGVPVGAEAKVVCIFDRPGQGMQVRRFRVVDQAGIGVSWQPVEIYPAGSATFHVVTTATVNVVYTP